MYSFEEYKNELLQDPELKKKSGMLQILNLMKYVEL